MRRLGPLAIKLAGHTVVASILSFVAFNLSAFAAEATCQRPLVRLERLFQNDLQALELKHPLVFLVAHGCEG